MVQPCTVPAATVPAHPDLAATDSFLYVEAALEAEALALDVQLARAGAA